ncbi:MAG: hypothetical protein KAV87_36030 [Desulfobacteraceae bacterium]|nr:hypothetical protein [Desulfobacteraceae bacterium]
MKKKKITKRQRKAASANNAMVDAILRNRDSVRYDHHDCEYVGHKGLRIPFIRVG